MDFKRLLPPSRTNSLCLLLEIIRETSGWNNILVALENNLKKIGLHCSTHQTEFFVPQFFLGVDQMLLCELVCVHISADTHNPEQSKLVGACSVQGDFSSVVPIKSVHDSVHFKSSALKHEGETASKQLLLPYNLVKSMANSS